MNKPTNFENDQIKMEWLLIELLVDVKDGSLWSIEGHRYWLCVFPIG